MDPVPDDPAVELVDELGPAGPPDEVGAPPLLEAGLLTVIEYTVPKILPSVSKFDPDSLTPVALTVTFCGPVSASEGML